ncbi:MAG: helix-turn-helix domain-containing protein [Thermoplasmata archaeon]
MFYMTFRIKSNCSLSMAANNVDKNIFSLNVINYGTKNTIEAFTMSKNIPEIRKALRKDFNQISITKDARLSFIFGVKESHGIMSAIIKNSGIPVFPFIAGNGYESFQTLLFSKQDVDTILNAVESKNYIENFEYEKIMNGKLTGNIIKRVNTVLYTSYLSDAEKKTIKKALLNGYFEWPRVVDLSNIASSLKVSKPTVLYHIRNAEKKILLSLFD